MAFQLFAQQKKTFGPFNLYEKNITIKIDSSKIIYTLPDSFLIQHSEKISIKDNVLIQGQSYNINYIDGTITLLQNFPHQTMLSIYYNCLPFNLQKTYFHRELIYNVDSVKHTSISPLQQISEKKTQRSSLKKSGSIVRGISLGSTQGLKVESGLRMNISGRIADKVDVIAALTDQTTPIQPEGNTQTLNEIDKVFVQIKGEHFKATLGDYNIAFQGSEFGKYNRKLQGAMGIAEFKNYSAVISGATSKGKYTSNKFNGKEGNQGPYQLKGDRGQIDIIVLAGTEKVWIDGEIMTRGEHNDYVIEYSNGQITFTRHRLITTDSRITIDFQYSDLKYQRSLYSIKTNAKLWNNKLNLDFRYLRESDNKDNPLDFTLSDENVAYLQAAGDNIDSSYVPGDRYVGDGEGNYVELDSAGLKFFKYTGKNLGDYNVVFSYVGANNGAYKSIGLGKYKFIGQKNGSYQPIILLQPAQSHDVTDLSIAYNPYKSLKFSNEIAISRFDKNSYSEKDDSDNLGLAYSSVLDYNSEDVKIKDMSFGKFSINGKYRIVNPKFNYIDRTDEVEKSRKWDSGESATKDEEIKEVKINYQPLNDVNFSGGIGTITKGTKFKSNRWQSKANISFKNIPKIQYKIEKIKSDNSNSAKKGDWLRQNGKIDYQYKMLNPFFNYTEEDKKEIFQDTTNIGFKYDEYESGIKLTNFKKMTAAISYITRQDKKYKNNILEPSSNATTQNYQWRYVKSSKFSTSIEYIHRDKIYTDNQQSNKKTDLGDLKIKYSPIKKALTTDWHYQISNTQIAKKERIYIKVNLGDGNYRFNEQTEEYEPYDLGDYILRIRQTDEFIPVVELRASSHIKFSPKTIFKKKNKKKWQKWISSISTETFIRIEEKTREDDVWAIYRMNFEKFQQPGKTILGNNSWRQDIFLFQNNRNFTVRFRYDTKKQVNYQYLEGGNETEFTEKSLRVNKRLSNKLSLQINGLNKYRSYLYTARSDKIIKTNELNADFSIRPRQTIEIAIKTMFAIKTDEAVEPATQVTEISFKPRASYSFRGKGKIHCDFDWTKVKVSPDDRILPYELVGINRSGNTFRWNIRFNYNISRHVRATVSYNGRIEPQRPDTIHIAKAEMRAYF